MTCLVIVESNLIDLEELAKYSEQAVKTVAAFDGHFITKGDVEVLHGDAAFGKKAVIQFSDKETARNWYESDEYQALIPQREKGMKSQFHLV